MLSLMRASRLGGAGWWKVYHKIFAVMRCQMRVISVSLWRCATKMEVRSLLHPGPE
jgi:hypothetical protein